MKDPPVTTVYSAYLTEPPAGICLYFSPSHGSFPSLMLMTNLLHKLPCRVTSLSECHCGVILLLPSQTFELFDIDILQLFSHGIIH